MGRCARGGRTSRRKDARGAVAVEFALILPVLMVIVVAIINFGDMLSVRQSVSQAASEGARAAAVELDATKRVASAGAARDAALRAQKQACNSNCQVVVSDCADSTALAPGALPGATDNSTTDTLDCVWVKVEITYSAVVPGFGLLLPERLRYTAVARVS